jgi:hypothetical protein
LPLLQPFLSLNDELFGRTNQMRNIMSQISGDIR